MRKDFQEKVVVRAKNYDVSRRWRLTHTDKRNASRMRNYHKTINSSNNFNKWTSEDEDIIMNSRLSDFEISKLINRSVQAIQVRRCKLMKLMEVNN